MNMKKVAGLVLLAVAVLAIVAGTQIDWDQWKPVAEEPWVDVTVAYGGEKKAFLHNPRLQAIAQEHHVRINGAKEGSIAMVTDPAIWKDKDCLWPSNQTAVEIAKMNGIPVLGDENIFNSPIVFYAWRPVTEAFIKEGIVEARGESYYVVNTTKLMEMIKAGKPWRDLGLPVYGKIRIPSTAPWESNSGNMWAGLQANLRNGGEVVTMATLDSVLPGLVEYFNSSGDMEDSSGDIFDNFLNQGMGSRPAVVGYENQGPEYILEVLRDSARTEQQRQALVTLIKSEVTILYPEPTVYSSHPLMRLTPACKRLEAVLTDPRAQDLAWREHGFRSGLMGVDNDPAVLQITGVPRTVNMVINMPQAVVMQRIIEALRPTK